MSEEKKIKIELPDVLEEPAKALAMPLAENAGTTIGDLWFLAFGGISQKAALRRAKYAIELEKYKRDLEKKLNDIPQKRRIEPNAQVALNALADSQSCVEEEVLREMFANLITAACDAEKASDVHPAFSGIIRQMTSIEAAILSEFNNKTSYPIVDYVLLEINGSRLTFKANLFTPNFEKFSMNDQNMGITSLKRLGMIEIEHDQSVIDRNRYEEFKQTAVYSALKKHKWLDLSNGRFFVKDVEIREGRVYLTDFGKRFLEVCT